MAWPALEPGEHVAVDLSAPTRSVVFPFLELIVITGALWITIGWLDNPTIGQFDPIIRNTVVVLWMVLVAWRFLLPVVKSHRSRFMVTNQRIMIRPAGLSQRMDIIPMRDIRRAWRRGDTIHLDVSTLAYPLRYRSVPKARKVEARINELVNHR